MEGRVVSDKTNKTITVLIERRIMDPLYKKFIRRTKKYTAHDEANAFRTGDVVKIEECAPISKTKRWKVISDVPADTRDKKPVEQALEARAAMLAAKPAPVKKAAKVEAKPVKAAPKPAKVEAPKAETAVKAAEKPAKPAATKVAKPEAAKAEKPVAAKAKPPAAKAPAKGKKKEES
jgi:small subunit ribosomal protein S17